MRYEPRPYQADAIRAALSFINGNAGTGGLLVEPTGSGKSVIIGEIARRAGRCVVFSPNREILAQNAAKIAAHGYSFGTYSASFGKRQIRRITLATIGSVQRRPQDFQGLNAVIVDECHLVNPKQGMYKRFLESMGDTRVVGLSATPYRLASNRWGSELRFLTRTRPRVFSHLLHFTQIRDLQRQGFLSPMEYIDGTCVDPDEFELNSTGADYLDESIRDHYEKVDFPRSLVEIVKNQIQEGRRVVVFTRFVEESAYLASQIDGVEVVSTRSTKADRDSIIRDFKRGKIPAVSNVGILPIGFDYPELDTVVLARPTLSLGLYYQQVGRAMRPHPSKAAGRIIDMVGLCRRFGKVENLELRAGGKSKLLYAFYSGRRQLTNVLLERKSP